jgi:hypothetical protein
MAELAKKKKRFFRKRVVLIIFICLIALLGALDFYSETYGVPGFLRDYIKLEAEKRGLIISSKKLRCGIVRGVIIDGVRVEDGMTPGLVLLKAENIKLHFSFSELFKGAFPFRSFSIQNASLFLPLFPDYGAEGLGDTINLEKFSATVERKGNELIVEDAYGELESIKFYFSGKIRNFTSVRSFEKNENSDPAEKKIIRGYSPTSYIENIPEALRIKLAKMLFKFQDETFDGQPEFHLLFNADAKDLAASKVEAKINIPDFKYGNLALKKIVGELSFAAGKLNVKNMRIDLGPGEFCDISGHGNVYSGIVDGDLKGCAALDKISLFMNKTTQDLVKKNLGTGKDLVSFSGQLDHYSFHTGRYLGKLKITAPGLFFNKLHLTKIMAELEIDSHFIKGTSIAANLPEDGFIKGAFMVDKREFAGDFTGKTDVVNIVPFFKPKTIAFIKKNLDFTTREPIEFKGKLNVGLSKNHVYKGNLTVSSPSLKIRGIDFLKTSAGVKFDEKYINISKIETALKDGTRLSGDINCLLEDRIFSASLFCTGCPQSALPLLEEDHKRFLNSLLKEVKWPDEESLVELGVDLHYEWKDDPYYFISGNIVMTNFAYKAIDFSYGATRFFIDSEDLIILPGLVIETTAGNAALIALAYDGRKQSEWDIKSPYLSSVVAPKGRFLFRLESNLTGTDLFKLLYPKWESEYLNFPKAVEVKAEGEIFYRDDMRTVFSANMEDGYCEWRKIPIENLDTKIEYANNTLKIEKASGNICGGTLDVDYSFNFDKETGHLKLDIEKARLNQMMKALGHSIFMEAGNKGTISCMMDSELAYDERNRLMMNGDGQMSVDNADIWSAPLFGGFIKLIGKVWSVGDLGTVTQMKCDFELEDDHFQTDSLQSDGGIIALKGQGEYFWHENNFEFFFQAEVLRNVLPFKMASYLFSPVTWLLTAKVYNKDGKVEWEQVSKIKGLFSK